METLYGEKFNNLTGDIQLNPASFGLFMRDIEEASLNLKTAIYNGNVELTADLYKEMEDISKLKYGLMSSNGGLEGNLLGQLYGVDSNGNFLDYNMSGKNPGLYMNHQRLGYWNGTSWNASITNSGQAYFGNDTMSNYLLWDGLNLTVRGEILLPSGNNVTTEINNLNNAVDNIDRSTLQGVPLMLQVSTAPSGSGLKITDTHLGYYNNGNWKTYMDQTGGFYLNGSGTNYLAWNGNTLTLSGELILPSGNNVTTELNSIYNDINNIQRSDLNNIPTILNVYSPPSGSGLRITNSNMGYYNNGIWKTLMDSTGSFYLGSTNDNNYLYRNGNTLNIKGNILLPSGQYVSNAIDNLSNQINNFSVDRNTLQGIPYMLQTTTPPSGSGLKITDSYMGYYNGNTWKTFIGNNGSFFLGTQDNINNYLSWNGSSLTIKGTLNSSTINGGIINGTEIYGGFFKTTNSLNSGIEIQSGNGFRVFDGKGNVRIRIDNEIDNYGNSGIAFFNTIGSPIAIKPYKDGTYFGIEIAGNDYLTGDLMLGRHLKLGGDILLSGNLRPNNNGSYCGTSSTPFMIGNFNFINSFVSISSPVINFQTQIYTGSRTQEGRIKIMVDGVYKVIPVYSP